MNSPKPSQEEINSYLKEMSRLNDTYTHLRGSFLSNLLIAECGVLGIVVSLAPSSPGGLPTPLLARWTLTLALCALLLSILLLGVALHKQSETYRRLHERAREELLQSMREHRALRSLRGDTDSYWIPFANAAYIAALVSATLLVSYFCLRLFA